MKRLGDIIDKAARAEQAPAAQPVADEWVAETMRLVELVADAEHANGATVGRVHRHALRAHLSRAALSASQQVQPSFIARIGKFGNVLETHAWHGADRRGWTRCYTVSQQAVAPVAQAEEQFFSWQLLYEGASKALGRINEALGVFPTDDSNVVNVDTTILAIEDLKDALESTPEPSRPVAQQVGQAARAHVHDEFGRESRVSAAFNAASDASPLPVAPAEPAMNDVVREAAQLANNAFDDLFAHCLSNGVFNAWGAPFDCTKMNRAMHALRRALAEQPAAPFLGTS